jgi:aryl-alcohol dehydrogenase-like predicted oxidoreductase
MEKINYKLLGQSGLRVSEFALGTMTFSLTNPWNWGITEDIATQIFRSYTDIGGNFIDTANNYANGESEKLIGKLLNGDRDRYVLATKFTLHENSYPDDPNAGGNHRKNILRTVNESLDRLNTDYIDLLYLHVWDYTTSVNEIMKTLNSLIEQNVVNYIGISDTPAWIVSKANTLAEYRGWDKFVAYQFPYNLAGRTVETDVIPCARDFGMSMLTWGVLASGLLSGKYTKGGGEKGRISNPDNIPEKRLTIAKEVDVIADEIGVSSATVAYSWIRSIDENIIPLLGLTKAEQLEQAFLSVNLKLSEDQINRLNQVSSFEVGFPTNFVTSQTVLDLIHGKTYSRLKNHRFQGF